MANQQNNNPKDRNQTQADRDNPQQGGQGQDKARQPQQENERNRQQGNPPQDKNRDPQRNA